MFREANLVPLAPLSKHYRGRVSFYSAASPRSGGKHSPGRRFRHSLKPASKFASRMTGFAAGFIMGLGLLLLSSCDLVRTAGTHVLRVSVPVMPECWSGIPFDGFELRWEDERGQWRKEFLRSGEECTIAVRRGSKQAVLAYPALGDLRFRPLGALYPYDVEAANVVIPAKAPDILILSPSSGYTALCADALQRGGRDPWAFAIEKLHTVWEKKDCDPWRTAPFLVAEALADGSFGPGVFHSDTKAIELPDGTVWWPESPFVKMRVADGRQCAELGAGLFRFWGSGAALLLHVSDAGVVTQVTDSAEWRRPSADGRQASGVSRLGGSKSCPWPGDG